MGTGKPPQRSLPIVGLIYQNNFPPNELRGYLTDNLGPVARESLPMPFIHTDYYRDEMGGSLIRQWIAFSRLVSPDELVDLKLWTNDLEAKNLNTDACRMVNLDPGIVTLSNLVLASTKNYSHRIYLGRGIYAEVTLIYKNNVFQPLDWTYPDYREQKVLLFFGEVRELLKRQLRDVRE